MFYKKNIFYAFCYFFIFAPIIAPIMQNIKINAMLIIEETLKITFPERINVNKTLNIITIINEMTEQIIGFVLKALTNSTVIVIAQIADIIVINTLSKLSGMFVLDIKKLEIINSKKEIISGTVMHIAVFIICFFI